MTVVCAGRVRGGETHREEVAGDFEVIYTGEGVTADSCIERLAYESVRTSREVHVVTSDGAEQSAILGAGAYRISSAELWRRVKKTKKKIADEYLGEVTLHLSHNEDGSRIDSRTAAKLDGLRNRSRCNVREKARINEKYAQQNAPKAEKAAPRLTFRASVEYNQSSRGEAEGLAPLWGHRFLQKWKTTRMGSMLWKRK